MPQATDELRERVNVRFGSIDSHPPWAFLASKGYTERMGFIHLPSPLHKITEEEGECIDFLCDEWDWAFENVTPT